ncbi:MAG: SRPBCC domain-containing protein [Muriicola sp.]|nr:SRPBCC domain-containing protein [Muriicola sp.]NNK10087.1 SRPBCC domain-containing protein [Flavobacteriaceae bacterium]
METPIHTPDKAEGYSIYHDLSIAAAPEEVFRAVSSPEHLVNWWPLKCSGTPSVGNTYNFYFTEEYNWFGKVSHCEPHTLFCIRMTQSDPDWNPTSFGFEIEATEGGVRLHFFHKNWQACNSHFKTASFCWAMLLNGLQMYLEKGIVLPFEERS